MHFLAFTQTTNAASDGVAKVVSNHQKQSGDETHSHPILLGYSEKEFKRIMDRLTGDGEASFSINLSEIYTSKK